MDCHAQQEIHKPFSVATVKQSWWSAMAAGDHSGNTEQMTGTCFRGDAPREAALYPIAVMSCSWRWRTQSLRRNQLSQKAVPSRIILGAILVLGVRMLGSSQHPKSSRRSLKEMALRNYKHELIWLLPHAERPDPHQLLYCFQFIHL